MKEEIKFYICQHCGNIIGMVHDSGARVVCCGDQMTPLVPNTTDAAHEKHVPVIDRNGLDVTVQVGSTLHPMAEDHYIEWICLVSGEKIRFVYLHPGDEPKAHFVVDGQDSIEVYAYCNKHGLWKA